MKCPYCKKDAVWGDNKMIYGRNYGKSYKCYYCKDCNAYVGTHKNSRKALGTMANKELRSWRIATHKVLDPIWREGKISRGDLYKRLANHFKKEVHVGESDIEMCKKIISYINLGIWNT